MMRNSKHISIAGTPNSFDYSCFDNLLAVSSLRAISLFSGMTFDNPSTELFYELPSGLTLSGFQKGKGGVFSCLNNDSVTIFKVSNCVREIHEAIVTPGRIFDSSWSPFNIDTLATCCDSGLVSLWDLRSVSSASLQIATGKVCHDSKWCPFNENLLSVCCEDRYLMIWDIRMTSNSKPSCLQIIEPFNGIHDYSWDQTKSCLFVGTSRTVECWNFNNNQCNDACDLRQVCNCDALSHRSQLLPHPNGEGILLSNTQQRNIQYLEMHPPTTEDVLWDSGFSEKMRSLQFETKHSLVRMQWIAASGGPNNDLLILTEGAILHRFNFDSTFSAAANTDTTVPKAFNLRNSRYLVGGVGKDDLESALNSNNSGVLSASSGSAKKSASRHPSATNNTATAAAAAAVKLQSTLKDVVGPVSFSNLLEHEIGALDSAIRGGLLDGLKIERFDQIGRRIVLDLLIPSIDPFLVRNKVHDGSFSNYYRAEELHQFVKKSSQQSQQQHHSSHHYSHYGHSNHRIVSLLISFSSKLVHFWTPTFLIDNKSGVDVGGDIMTSKILNDLSAICKTFTAATNLDSVSLSPPPSRLSLPIAAASSTDADQLSSPSEGLLMQIGRYFRKSILRQWEKRLDSDRLSVSFGSFRPNSSDNINNGSSKLMNNATSSLGQSLENIQSGLFNSIEALAHKVPYPMNSGGVFNARGELVCFGSAVLQRPGEKQTSIARSPFQNRSYAWYQYSVLARNNVSTTGLVVSSSTPNSEEDSNNNNSKPLIQKDGFTMSISVDTTTNLNYDNQDQNAGGSNISAEEDDSEYDYQFSFDRESRTFPKIASGAEELTLKDIPTTTSTVSASKDIKRNISVSSYFVADLDFKSEGHTSSKSVTTPVFHFSSTLCVHRGIFSPVMDLAEQYSLGPLVYSTHAVGVGSDTSSQSKLVLSEFSKRAEACRFNAQVVQSCSPHSRSLYQFWSLLAVALDVYTVVDTGGLIGWNNSVLGCSLLFRLIQYLWRINDLQTFAVAICVAGGSRAVTDLIRVFQNGPQFQQQASHATISFAAVELNRLSCEIDNILYSYAEVLRKWGSHSTATAVAKHMTVDYYIVTSQVISSSDPLSQESASTLSVGVHCMNCDKLIDKDRGRSNSNSSSVATLDASKHPQLLATYCQDCNDWAQYCAICQSSIRGYFAVCGLCGHGGHTAHMRLWFETCGECATGCGCKCSLVSVGSKRVSKNSLLEDLEDSDVGEYGDDGISDDDGDVHYDRAGVITVYGAGAGEVNVHGEKPGYDTYDFNRPYDGGYDSNNYSRYNYNNFFEQMKDYPGSIMEEGSGSEEDS